MIIRGGENVYPREIEEFLYTHPDILEAQVFGIPDEKYGEIVCAWVQQRDGADLSAADIKAYCADQITHFKVPSIVRFVGEFPMTVTGKIQSSKCAMRPSQSWRETQVRYLPEHGVVRRRNRWSMRCLLDPP